MASRRSSHVFRVAAPLLVALGIALPASLLGQSPTSGRVAGRVIDDRGITVPSATLTILRGTDRIGIVEADPEGRFRLDDLEPGAYTILVEQLGFQPIRYHQVRVVAGDRLDIALEIPRRPPPINAVEDRWLRSSGVADAGSVIDGAALQGLDPGRDAFDLLRDLSFASTSGEGRDLGWLAATGRPASDSRLLVDGVEEPLLRHPGLPGEASTAPIFTRDGVDQVRFSRSRLDASLPASTGALTEFTTRWRSDRTSIAPWASWAGASLGGAAEDNPADSSGTSIQGGVAAAGPIGHDSSSWALRADYRRLAVPSADPFTAEGLAGMVASARPDVALAPWTAPTVRTWQGFTGLGQLQLRPSATSRISARAGVASWTEENPLLSTELASGAGSSLDARDLSAALTAEFWGEEFRSVGSVSVQHASRYWSGAGVPGTILASEGAQLGGTTALPAEFRETWIGAHEAAYFPADQHLLSIGLGVTIRRIRYDWLPDAEGLAAFGSLDDFSAGRGTWRASSATNAAPDLSIPEFALFVQDNWHAAAGLRLDFGLRYQAEVLPKNRLTLNPGVANAFGVLTDVLPRSRSSAVGPRIGIRLDPDGRGRTTVRLATALEPGRHDAAAFAEAVRNDGSVTITRASGDLAWPSAPAAADAVTAPVVTFYGSQVRAPRTLVVTGGIDHAIAEGTVISLTGGLRHTDYLLRRDDINRPVTPFGHTADGMAIWGALEQFDALLVPVPGANRRVAGFDQVWALSSTGYAEQQFVTATMERRAASGLSLMASYTWSKTTDNMVGQLSADPADRVVAVATDANVTGGWSDARSDLDVPHRVVLSARYRSPGAGNFLAGARWRWRSGLPFTPGYAPGVDANGDGSATNDPVGLGSVSGLAGVLSGAGCDGGSAGLAARNSCRAPAVQSLDLELGWRLPVGSGRGVVLTVDAFNVVSSDVGAIDRAAVLVDPSGALSVDAAGNVVLPLMLNDHFGQLLSRRSSPRSIRFGLRVEN